MPNIAQVRKTERWQPIFLSWTKRFLFWTRSGGLFVIASKNCRWRNFNRGRL